MKGCDLQKKTISFDLSNKEIYALYFEQIGEFFITPKGKFYWSSISAAKNAYLIHKYKGFHKVWSEIEDPPVVVHVGTFKFQRT